MHSCRLKLKRNNNNHGAVLAIMVMLILLLSLTSLALIRVGQEARIRTVRDIAETRARFAADAGVERALYQMNKLLEYGVFGIYGVPTYVSETLTACDADYTVTYTGDLSSGYAITSVGHSGNTTQTVRVTVALTSPMAEGYAVLTKDDLEMKSKSTVSGYNSSDPSETGVPVAIGTLSTESGSIDIKNGAVVEGDVYVGINGDPDTVIHVKNSDSIEGETFVMPMTYDLPSVTAPFYLASHGKISGKYISLNSWDSGKYSEIEIRNDGRLEINGDVTLYITGDITLKNDSELKVKNGSSLVLYFRGDIEAKNNSEISNESKIPSNIKMYGTGSHQNIDLKNRSDIYAVIYAPNADMVLHNKVDAYGSFIVDDFVLKNSGNLYYDKALKEVSINDETAYFTVTQWEEL